MDFNGKLEGKDTAGTNVRITLDGNKADIAAGGNGRGGDVLVLDGDNQLLISLSAGTEQTVGPGPLLPGGVEASGVVRISGAGSVLIGDSPNPPALKKVTVALQALKNAQGVRSGELLLSDGDGKTITLRAVDGNDASVIVGGEKRSGWIVLRNSQEKDAAFLSGHAGHGLLELRNADGVTMINLDAGGGAGRFGGQNIDGKGGVNGDVLVFSANAPNQNSEQASIWLQGSTGDIVLQNADCAEEFDVSGSEAIEPGTVMVLDEEGKLQQSRQAYDKKVAGVISGAGDFKPGIVLDKKYSENRMPLALLGKVYCRVDAQYCPIEVGDLLTTSATPGHAMRAGDPLKAFGAVIGKALRPLSTGCGLIPILIALQ